MRKHLRRGQKGFTLIELMIVVAIIGILAAIAIPNFLRFQLRARSSEGKTNIAALRTAQESFQAEFGNYVSANQSPAAATIVGAQGSIKDVFTGNAQFTSLGWAPEGRVYFTYASAAPAPGVNYTIDAQANIDGDAAIQLWGYIKPSAAGVPTNGKLGCILATNTAVPQLVAQTVGPCALGSGSSVF